MALHVADRHEIEPHRVTRIFLDCRDAQPDPAELLRIQRAIEDLARSAEELPNRPAPSGGLTARATVLEVGDGPGEPGWLRRPSMLTEIDNAECR